MTTINQPIPERVRSLILQSIDSVSELEALLLLRETLPRCWKPEEVSARLYVSQKVAEYSLNALVNRGMLDSVEDCYVYRATTPDLEHDVTALAQTYSTNLIAVTHLIHAKPAPSVQDFAQAFRWRKDT